MALTLPTTTSIGDLNRTSEEVVQVRQSLDKTKKLLGEVLDPHGTIIQGPAEPKNIPDGMVEIQATWLRALEEQLNTLGGCLIAMEEDLCQRRADLLEETANIASTMATTSTIADKRRDREMALTHSQAKYMVVVLLLSASLLTALFALFFVSTQK